MTTRFVAFLALFLVPACGGGGAASSPVTLFEVTQVTPPDQSENVPLTDEVDVIFSKAVDFSSIDAVTLRVVAESGDEIPGQRSINPLNPGVVKFRPLVPYFAFAVHTIEVGSGVRDSGGARLNRTYRFEFQTQEKGPRLPRAQDIEDLGNLLVTGRWFHRMTLLASNRFLVAGGYTSENSPLDLAENLIPVLRQCTTIPSHMILGRAAHVQVMLADGRVLIAGGEISSDPFLPIDRCEIFDPIAFTFGPAASMHVTRSFAEGVLLTDGRVLVTGGQSTGPAGFQFLNDAEIYDPVADRWTLLPSPMLDARSGHFSAPLPNGDAIIIGGTPGRATSERFASATGDFAAFSPPPQFVHFFGTGVLLPDGRPVVFSGVDATGVSILDPSLGFIGAVNQMASPRVFATATTFADGRVLVVGGTDFSGASPVISDTMDLFFPIGTTGKVFRATATLLPRPTSHHAAGRGPEGAVWITGGLPSDDQHPGERQVVVVKPGTP